MIDYLNEMAYRLNEPIRQYQRARAEHAFRMRMEGQSYREVGEHLGVSACRARELAYKGERLRHRDERNLQVVRCA